MLDPVGERRHDNEHGVEVGLAKHGLDICVGGRPRLGRKALARLLHDVGHTDDPGIRALLERVCVRVGDAACSDESQPYQLAIECSSDVLH